MDPKLSLSWDAYQKSICNGLSLLQQRGEFVDMTLAADGHHVKVHQMVMSLVSPYIKDLIKSANCPHPVILLNRISYQTLQAVLEYAYTGEVLVARESLYEFLDACKVLHIKGLEDESIKASADGAMMRLCGDAGENSPVPTSPSTMDRSVMRGVKRKRTETVEYAEQSSNEQEQSAPEEILYCDEEVFDDFEEEGKTIEDENAELYAKAKRAQDTAGSVVQYSLSCQGSIQLILNRFIYRLRHPRKNNEKMYRCAEYNKKGCPAYVVTKEDIVLERGCAHSHPFHDAQILKRVLKGNMYTQYKAAETVASMNKKTAPSDRTKGDNGED